jgi:hypothetical protein
LKKNCCTKHKNQFTCWWSQLHKKMPVSGRERERYCLITTALKALNLSLFINSAPIIRNIDLSVGLHHTIQWLILKPCGRFWFLVLKKYIFLTLFFGFILSSYWQISCSFIPAYFWHSVNTHIWTSVLFIYCLE